MNMRVKQKASGESRRGLAFSLMELLVTVSIIVILMACTLPVVSKIMARSKTVQCVGNLKYCGAALSTYIAEQGGVYKNWMAGTQEYAKYWTAYLRWDVGYSEADLLARRCGLGKFASNIGSHYGFYVEDPHGKKITPVGGITYYEIRFSTHPNPARAIMLGDSLKDDNTQIHTVRNGSAIGRGGFHTLHDGRANVYFADGHIESVTPARFRELGVDRIYGENGQQMVTPQK